MDGQEEVSKSSIDASTSSTTESNLFIDKANTTQKKFGHNKLQYEIDQLHDDLRKARQAASEQEMKLGLFKKTISTLQSQLQDKSAKIRELENLLENNEHTKLLIEARRAVEQKNEEIESLKSELQAELQRSSETKTDVEALSHSNTDYETQINTLQTQYSTIKEMFDAQTKTVQDSADTIDDLNKKLGLQMSISENLQSELETLKVDLASYKSHNDELQLSLEQKDEQVQLVSLQLGETEIELQKHLQPPPQPSDTGSVPAVNGATRGTKTRERRRR
jgi:chromosome segregation ATPase